MARPYKGRSGRIQARGAGGRFRQWTGEEFGIGVCPRCQHITVRPELPQTPFIDPRDFNARVCPGCGWDSRRPEANPKDTFAFSELGREHQVEIVGNLGRKVAERTIWKLVPDFPVDAAAALADSTSIQIFDSDVQDVMDGIRRKGKVTRPILIDETGEEAWMEGRHRSFASQELGLKTIPALYRVE